MNELNEKKTKPKRSAYKFAVLIIGAGIVLILAGMLTGAAPGVSVFFGNGRFHIAGMGDSEQKTISLEGRFDRMDISAAWADIKFIESDTYRAEITYHYAEPDARIEDGLLYVRQRADNSGALYFSIFNFGNTGGRSDITVYFPKNAEFSDIRLQTTSGDMTLSGFITDGADISASSGNLRVSGAAADQISISATSGGISLTDFTARDAETRASSGDTRVSDSNIRNLNISTTSGDVRVDNLETDSLRAEVTSGEIEMTRLTSKGMFIRSSSGDIDVSGALEGNIEIRATSGDVDVTTSVWKESFSADISVRSGDIEYGGQRVGKAFTAGVRGVNHFQIETTSGDVEVEFRN